MLEVILNIGVPVAVIILAMVTGTLIEKRHFRLIAEREEKLGGIALLTGKEFPEERKVLDSRLVSGSAVVSIDYFKRFLASLRNIFGGEVRSYCSLLDRGRREAILRMKESYPDADLVVNVRLETSSISKGRKNRLGSVEVLVYGTAIKLAD